MNEQDLINFDSKRVHTFLSFVNHIDILNSLTRDEIAMIFSQLNLTLFNLIDRLGISEVNTLIYLHETTRDRFVNHFNEKEIFILLDNFERNELDLMFESLDSNTIKLLIKNFKMDEFRLLFELSSLYNNFDNLIFFVHQLTNLQKKRIFKLKYINLSEYIKLNDEQKKFLVENYKFNEIKLILKKFNPSQISRLRELNQKHRIRILKFKDAKFLLDNFNSNELSSLLDTFGDLDLEELNSRDKYIDRIYFIDEKYSSLILI